MKLIEKDPEGTCICVCPITLVMSDSETPWTVACQASLSMGFPRQEHLSQLPFLLLWHVGDPPNPAMETASLALQAGFFTAEPLGKP